MQDKSPITIELRKGHEIWKKVNGKWYELKIGGPEYNHYSREMAKIEGGDIKAGKRVTS